MPQYAVLTQTYSADDLRREWAYDSGPPRQLTFLDYQLGTGQLIGQGVVNGPPDPDGFEDGRVLYGPAREGYTRVSVYYQAGAPVLEAIENFYGEPTVTCDLSCAVTVSGFLLSLEVLTSHPPFETSLDNNNWEVGKIEYGPLPAGSGVVYVRDAGDGINACVVQRPYTITGEPVHDGELIDTFGPDSDGATHSLYYTTNPRLIEDFTSPPTPVRVQITEQERGRADGAIFRTVCEGTSLVEFVAILTPPYALVQVTPNSPTCGAPVYEGCTLQVTGVATTTESAAGRDATATVQTSGAQGSLLYSLDRFRTPGQEGPVFTGLLSGRHLVTVKEDRADGCLATYEFTVTTTHGLRYVVPAWTDDGQPCEARIFLRGYTGAVETLESQPSPILITWEGGATDHVFSNPVQASTLELQLIVTREGQLEDAFAPDERYAKAEVWVDEQLEGVFWLTPSLYDAAHLAPPFVMTLRGTDGLPGLKELSFATASNAFYEGLYSDVQLVQRCLELLDYALPINTSVNLYAVGMDSTTAADPLAQVYTYAQGLITDKGEPMSCRDVLGVVLGKYDAQLRQEQGQWWVERLRDVARASTIRRHYTAKGVRLVGTAGTSDEALLRVITPDTGNLFWQTCGQRLLVLPAMAGVEVEATPGGPLNLLSATTWEPSYFLKDDTLVFWRGMAPVARQEPAKKNEPAGLRFIGDNPDEWVQTPAVAVGNARDTPRVFAELTLSLTAYFDKDLQIPDGTETGPAPGFENAYPLLRYAVQYNNLWRANLTDFQATPFIYERPLYQLQKPVEIKIPLVFEPGMVSVRFYATQDLYLTNIRLTNGEAYEEEHTDLYRTRNQLAGRLTQTDTELTLLGSDTPGSVLLRTSLLDSHMPTQAWYTLGQDPDTAVELGDHLVADRQQWQQAPAQVLTGVLRGNLRARQTITDPQELIPRGYKQTSHSWDVVRNTHTLTMTELLSATIGVPIGPGIDPPGAALAPLYVGPAAQRPLTAADVRALPTSQLPAVGLLTLLTGTTHSVFALALPPGYAVVSVLDVETGADLTDQYAASALLLPTDANPTGLLYTLYVMAAAVPYLNAHHHQFTLRA